MFLAIFQVLPCVFLIFVSFSRFIAIFQVLPCAILIFHLFQCFSPYSRSKSVCVSFSTFFQFSRHIPSPTLCISQFLCISVFLTLFQILKCPFLIFHVLQYFSPYSRSYIELFSFSKFFSFSRHISVHTVFVYHFLRFSVLSP